MTDEKKVPGEIPSPDGPTPQGAGPSDEEQLQALLEGKIDFQNYLGLSNEVLLAFANQGYLLFTEGKYEQAAQIFRGLVTIQPDDAYYHTALGSIYAEQGETDAALLEFNVALELDPEDIHALANRGEIYLRKGDVLEAANDFKKTIEIDENRINAAKESGESTEPAPAAQRARALSVVTYEVLKEIESKVKEAQASED